MFVYSRMPAVTHTHTYTHTPDIRYVYALLSVYSVEFMVRPKTKAEASYFEPHSDSKLYENNYHCVDIG